MPCTIHHLSPAPPITLTLIYIPLSQALSSIPTASNFNFFPSFIFNFFFFLISKYKKKFVNPIYRVVQRPQRNKYLYYTKKKKNLVRKLPLYGFLPFLSFHNFKNIVDKINKIKETLEIIIVSHL